MKARSHPPNNRVCVSPKLTRLALGAMFIFISLAGQRRANATDYVVKFRLTDSLKQGNELFIHLVDADGNLTETKKGIPTKLLGLHTIVLKGNLKGEPKQVRVHSGDHRDTWEVKEFGVSWKEGKTKRSLMTTPDQRVNNPKDGYGLKYIELGEVIKMRNRIYTIEFKVRDGIDRGGEQQLHFYLYSGRDGEKIIGKGIGYQIKKGDRTNQVTSQTKHKIEMYGHLNGPPTGIRLFTSHHVDNWSVGDFKVTWKEPGNTGDTTIASSQYVTHKPGDGYKHHFIDFQPAIRFGPTQSAKQIVAKVFYLDARKSGGGDTTVHQLSTVVGEEVSVSNQTAQNWEVGMSTSITASAGLPGIAESEVTADFSASYGEEYAQERAAVTSFENAAGLSQSATAEANTEKFFRYDVIIPYDVKDIIGAGDMHSIRKISGVPEVTVVTPIAIGPNMQPVPKADVMEMLEIYKGWNSAKAKWIEEKRLSVWLDNGWVYEGDSPPSYASRLIAQSDSLKKSQAILSDVLAKVPTEQHKFVWGGVGLFGFVGFLGLIKAKRFKWKLAGLVSFLVAAVIGFLGLFPVG